MRELERLGHTIATAESCTGGMISALLTDVSGVSKSFPGGAVTYSNEEKVRQLGVSQETLEAHGAVSEEVVIWKWPKASGRERMGTDWGVAVSGIAGPWRRDRREARWNRLDCGCWALRESARARCFAGHGLASVFEAWLPTGRSILCASNWENSEKYKQRRSFARCLMMIRCAFLLACLFPCGLLRAVANAASDLKERSASLSAELRWVPPARYHVTLAYLGWADPAVVPAIVDAVGQATAVGRKAF